ncbi:hypothetical protein OQA88_871 [Cercophora sp. LCS_1]
MTHTYTPLPPNHIRLLRLHPAPHIASPLECTLFETKLNTTPYEALSYTWGSPTPTSSISLSSTTIPSTTNLCAALRALRKRNEPRILWVDAICINQADLVEQGAQVRMMWEIYKAAECVVVWLGDAGRDSDVAMDNIAARDCERKLKVRETMREGRRCGCHAGEWETHPDRTGVLGLVGRKWFTRVWVLQEVAAAKKVVVACGDRTVSGNEFYQEIMGLSSWIASLQKVLRKSMPVLELMNQSSGSLGVGSLPLLELMERFRSWDATKPVDKLFALLSFSSDASKVPELQPDYTVSPEELARRIVRFALPGCVVDDTAQGAGTEVTFEAEGFLLGEIVSKMSGGGQGRRFRVVPKESKLPMAVYNPRARELFARDAGWEICIENERKLDLGESVVLLRGASRPTVVSFWKGELNLVMLAAPEPTTSGTSSHDRVREWDSAVQTLAAETEGLIKFKLSWDPFRKPFSSELSKHTLSPNDHFVQWEALIERMRDRAEAGNEEEHDCRTLAMLNMMFSGDRDAVKAGTSEFTTTLPEAALNGWYRTVKVLLDANSDVNATLDESGLTALHLAVIKDNKKIVRALLDAKASVDVVDANGLTPIEVGMQVKCDGEMIRMLLGAGATLPKLNIIKTDRTLAERLFDLVFDGTAEEVKELLQSEGADPNKVTKEFGPTRDVTGLHIAAELGKKEKVAAFLEAGTKVDCRTSEDTTPLHQAAMNGHSEVVELLLKAGADVNARDDNGTTPLDFALHRQMLETAQIIAAAGGKTARLGREAEEEVELSEDKDEDDHHHDHQAKPTTGARPSFLQRLQKRWRLNVSGRWKDGLRRLRRDTRG